MNTAPFSGDTKLRGLVFQICVQLLDQEKRPNLKEKALKRVGASFQAFLEAGGTDPVVLRLFYQVLVSSDASAEELQTCLENFVETCPTDVGLRAKLVSLLRSDFPDKFELIKEESAKLLHQLGFSCE